MASAHPITDHDEIRRWAEERNAKPACVKGTGGKGDPGMIRLDLPGFSGAKSLQPITWREWFRQFDENDLALLVQEQTARGQRSNFNKLVSRETARAQGSGRRKTASRKGATAGSGSAKSPRRSAPGARRSSTPRTSTRAANPRSAGGKTSSSRKTSGARAAKTSRSSGASRGRRNG